MHLSLHVPAFPRQTNPDVSLTLGLHRHASAIRGTFHLSLPGGDFRLLYHSDPTPSPSSNSHIYKSLKNQTISQTPTLAPTTTMDEDLIALTVMVGVLIVLPLSVVTLVLGSVSYARTKAWDRARNQRATAQEALLPGSSSDDSEFYDTDDENEANERKAEESREAMMTFGQKWRKEFGKAWKGKGMVQIQKEREREERRKLAKAVAKELERRERRAARKIEAGKREKEGLPRYEA